MGTPFSEKDNVVTDLKRRRRQHSPVQADQGLNERGAELLMLLGVDQVVGQKKRAAPSKKVLDKLLKLAMDQFVAYQGRIGKVHD